MFGAVKLTRNANPDNSSYSEHGIEFDSRALFSVPNSDWGKNVIIFGVDKSSSVHANNKNKDTLILGKGQTQGLDNITLTAKGEYSINFSKSQRKFSSLHYNGSNSFLSAHATKVYQFKAKDSKVKAYSLCLGSILIDFSVDKVKKGALNRYVHDFNFDYNAISVDDVLQIHKYLMRKHDMK